MNPEEDILYLFLSSHGFEDHELWIDFYPLTLNNLTAKDVKSALDDSGIKWRVIVISSCYSGGFIETLRDDFSLILTDANAEGVSYLGKRPDQLSIFANSYFDHALSDGLSFVDAYSIAVEEVRRVELEAGIAELSNPQISIGSQIGAKLERLEQRLQITQTTGLATN